MSSSALVVVFASPLWGRAADTWRRKPLLVVSLSGACVGLAAFAGVVQAGLVGVIGTTTVLALLLLTRGLVFGGMLAALPIAAQSLVADLTPDRHERVRGLSRLGAAVGLALVLGPGLGGLLGRLGLAPALLAAPILLGLCAVIVQVKLPPSAAPVRRKTVKHAAAGPSGFLDRRLRRPLIVGGVVYLSTSLLQTSIAFLLQDRLGLTPTQTVSVAGLTLLAGGVPMLVVQALVIPRLDWDPARLVATGVPLTALAFATIAGASTLWLIVAATVLSGIGHSLAIPGYVASVSLSVGPAEQGYAAGRAASAQAVALTIGPLVATGLYQLGSSWPFILGAAGLLCVLTVLPSIAK